jgi:hypothetical protein
MAKRSAYPPWIKLQMEALTPNNYFIIPPHVTAALNPTNFRTMIFAYNRRYNTNLKFHVSSVSASPPSGASLPLHETDTLPSTGKQWWVWYCPDSKLLYPEEKLQLVAEAQTLNAQLLSYMDNDQFDNAALAQTQLDKVKEKLSSDNTTHKVYHNKGSITQPLQRILAHLNLTAAQFARIHPREQIKLRIKAGIEITKQQRQENAHDPKIPETAGIL